MMSHNCHGNGGCGCSKVGWILVVIGGLNWGLIGLGMLMGSDWNVVGMLLGSMPTLLAIVYLLVGIATVISIVGCPCKKCKEACKSCQVGAPNTGPSM